MISYAWIKKQHQIVNKPTEEAIPRKLGNVYRQNLSAMLEFFNSRLRNMFTKELFFVISKATCYVN